MALASFDYLNPSTAVGMGLTPERTNYLDVYNFATNDIPHLKAAAIEKYDNTITGFIEKMAGSEQLTADKVIWSELERSAISYDDAVYTAATNRLTRNPAATVSYRLHEKVVLNTAAGRTGTFIVTSVVDANTVVLGTYDSNSLTFDGAGDATSVFTYSLGIEALKGSLGADFTTGIRQPYSIYDNRPAITREVYSELGSVIPDVKWITINGQPKWYIHEVDLTRKNFLEAIEKKYVEGDAPAATTTAIGAGYQGTQGLFSALRERGGVWNGYVTTAADLESLAKHLDKVQGAGVNLLLSDFDQEAAFDELGQSFNSNYGTAILPYVGAYNNAETKKILNLGFFGFSQFGYTFTKQGWKYLKENTFRGNAAIAAANRVNFVMTPVGMTPISDGDANLAFNPRKLMANYMTKYYKRDYQTQMEGGFGSMGANTNGDDKWTIHFLNEACLCAHAAEKWILGEGVAS